LSPVGLSPTCAGACGLGGIACWPDRGVPIGPLGITVRWEGVIGRIGAVVRWGVTARPGMAVRWGVTGRPGMAVRWGSVGRVTMRGAGAGRVTVRGAGAGRDTVRGAGAGRDTARGAGAGRAAGAAGFFGGCCAGATVTNAKEAAAVSATKAIALAAHMLLPLRRFRFPEIASRSMNHSCFPVSNTLTPAECLFALRP